MSRLEERLGLRLFVRTTRQIRLTDDGRVYFEQCRQALSQLVDAERQVMGRQAAPAGTLRISMPTPMHITACCRCCRCFANAIPQVQLDVHLSNRNIDFVEEGYDIAIRVRAQPDSTLIARHLEDAPLVVVATRQYLKQAGTPKTLDDLAQHECIQYELPSSGRRIAWLFNEARQATRHPGRRRPQQLGRRARRRHAGQTPRRPVPDLPLHRRERARQRRTGGSAEAFQRPLAPLHPALPKRTPCAACACGCSSTSCLAQRAA
jgi:DNA-binding transcriptional LysR family regulator